MARRKNAPDAIRIKNGLSERLRQLRTEFYGERGGPDQARTLGIPVRTWYNYENGVTVPAEIILRVVELTSVEPIWLLRGEGPKFRGNAGRKGLASDTESLAGSSVKDLLRVAIERLEENERTSMDFSFGPPIVSNKDDEGTQFDPELSHTGTEGRFDLRSFFNDEKTGEAAQSVRLEGRRNFRNLRVADDAMVPIVAEGAHVTFGEAEVVSESFHEKMVVAVIDGKPIVRWFQHCGKFGLLRAENPAANPPSILVELDGQAEAQSFHRVLWISTPH